VIDVAGADVVGFADDISDKIKNHSHNE